MIQWDGSQVIGGNFSYICKNLIEGLFFTENSQPHTPVFAKCSSHTNQPSICMLNHNLDLLQTINAYFYLKFHKIQISLNFHAKSQVTPSDFKFIIFIASKAYEHTQYIYQNLWSTLKHKFNQSFTKVTPLVRKTHKNHTNITKPIKPLGCLPGSACLTSLAWRKNNHGDHKQGL